MRRLLALFLAMTVLMPLASAATYHVNENGDKEFHYREQNLTVRAGDMDVFIIDVKKGMEVRMDMRLINTTSNNSGELFSVRIDRGDGHPYESSILIDGYGISAGLAYGREAGRIHVEVYADNTTTYSIEIKSTYSILEAIGLSGLCAISLLVLASLIAVYHYASVKQKRDALKEAGELGEDIKENPEKHIER